MTNETYEKIIELFKKENMKCLNNNLKDIKKKSTEKIIFKCNVCGEEYKCSYKNLLDTRRVSPLCTRCFLEKAFIERLNTIYGRNPYEFISQFKSNSEPLTVRCKDCGFEFTVNKAQQLACTHNLPEGAHPCKKCTKGRLKKNKGLNIKSLEDKLTELFGECNYTFPNPEKFNGIYSKSPILAICKKCGNEIYTIPNNLLHPSNGKHVCAKCNSPVYIKVSNSEKELVSFLRGLIDEEIQLNNRDILDKGLELDIYIPSMKIAFEYDGLYWHSDKYKSKDYHLNKTLNCEEKGIRLIHIFEDEWVNKNELTKKKIKHILKKDNSERIHARKCLVREINSKQKNEFLNKNHIQGEDKSNISKGLFFNDELVAVMTFVKERNSLGHKENSNYRYELSRFATSYNIPGAFQKLFKNILKEHPEIEVVITYADLRWSSKIDNVYIKNNFKLININKSSYWYCNGFKRYHRYNFRKQVLKTKFPDLFDKDLTEFEIMDKTNFSRIWDCGNLVYAWTRNNKKVEITENENLFREEVVENIINDKTKERVEEYCRKNNLELLEIIRNNPPESKSKVLCKKCGEIFIRSNSVWHRLPYCCNCNKLKIKQEKLIKYRDEFLDWLSKTDYENIDDVVDSKTRIRFKNKITGSILSIEPTRLKTKLRKDS